MKFRTDFIRDIGLEIGLVGGGIISRLEGAAWMFFDLGGVSTLARLCGRRVCGLDESCTSSAYPVLWRDRPAVWLEHVFCCLASACVSLI